MPTLPIAPNAVATIALLVVLPTAIATAQTGATVPNQDEFTRLATAKLSERFGVGFGYAPVRYVKCSKHDYATDRYYGPQQTCRFEFGTERTRRAGDVSFQYNQLDGKNVLAIASTTDGRYDPRGRGCPVPTAERSSHGWTVASLRAPGAYRRNACSDGLALMNQIRRSGTKIHLPTRLTIRRPGATAGYPSLDTWRCKLRRSRSAAAVECITELGDRTTAALHRD